MQFKTPKEEYAPSNLVLNESIYSAGRFINCAFEPTFVLATLSISNDTSVRITLQPCFIISSASIPVPQPISIRV